MKMKLLALSTAVPSHSFSQMKAAEIMVHAFGLQGKEAARVRKIYAHSAIENRHSVLEDASRDFADWEFYANFPVSAPGMRARNDLYKREAVALATQVSLRAVSEWGGNPQRITHVISVSCTGVLAPGIEYLLIEALQLSPSVERFGINFMGCFGAFKALGLAQALVAENPDARILIVCTELCTLHLQPQNTVEQHVANALFSDGSAAVIVGGNDQSDERVIAQIVRRSTRAISGTRQFMSWEAGDHGYVMGLSPEVARYLEKHIKGFAQDLLGSTIAFDQCVWAVHPGGTAILKAIEIACALAPEQTEASWHVLAKYGTMSSATFLFVLQEIYRRRERISSSHPPWCVGLGFGPGLSVEGLLLQ